MTQEERLQELEEKIDMLAEEAEFAWSVGSNVYALECEKEIEELENYLQMKG